MLAHDSGYQRAALKVALSSSGWFEVVSEVSSGDELVPELRTFQPDIAVVRLLLPKRNGLAVLPDLLDASPSTLVVLLSVTPSAELEGIAVARGADLCLEEGLPPDRIVGQLLRMMSRTEWLRSSDSKAR